MNIETKAAVTVAEMARMCGLSRARFYQLIGSTFPWPIYDVSSRRPFYDEEAQKLCLEVRKRNFGVNGKQILFYARRLPIAGPTRVPKHSTKSQANCAHQLLDGLRALGLNASSAQVESALKDLGMQGTENGEALRAVFVHLKRKGV